MKKELIYFDQQNYDGWLAREQEARETFDSIVSLAQQALATDKIDIVQLMENPREYVVNKYFDMYSTTIAPNVDKERWMLSQTTVNLSRFEALAKTYKDQVQRMKKHAPEITEKGFVSGLKKESFNWYLDESKRKHYEATKNLLEGINSYREFPHGGEAHIGRFCPDIQVGIDLIPRIRYEKFRA